MSTEAVKSTMILDGGMSRELIRLKAPFRQPEWSALALIEAPHLVRQVHGDFLSAGADVVTTNSYALVPFHIGEQRFWERAEELAATAGRLAREAADAKSEEVHPVVVAGSLPPVFGSYEPEKFDSERVQDYLAVLVRGLGPYVDVWLGETLSLIAEGKAVDAAVRHTGKPLWISFTLDDSEGAERRTPSLRSGESVVEAAQWAGSLGVEALLFNCSRPEVMKSAVVMAKRLRPVQEGTQPSPLIGVYANAFEPRTQDQAANVDISETREDLTVDAYTQIADEWIQSGADIVGGCFGVGHEHIRRLAMKLKSGFLE